MDIASKRLEEKRGDDVKLEQTIASMPVDWVVIGHLTAQIDGRIKMNIDFGHDKKTV
jgi:hypothetical protein